MKAFVTGATGFLGSHLVDRLLEEGWEVHALVRKSSSLRWLHGKAVNIHYGDVTGEERGLEEGLRGVDVCFHLAGVILAPQREMYFRINAEGTRNLMETTLRVNPKIKRVVVVTSLAAHGPGLNDDLATEDQACRPITPYGESKRDAELIALQYKDRLPVTIIRPPAIYGPRDKAILNYFKIAKTGFMPVPWGRETQLNLVHVRDVVTGILLAAAKDGADGEVFFVGDKRNYSWDEIVGIIESAGDKRIRRLRVPTPVAYVVGAMGQIFSLLTGKIVYASMANIRNFVQRNWALDISKAERLLGYQPACSLEEGIKETLDWYRREGWI